MPNKITRLRISNYRGIRRIDAKVGPGGVVAKGRNGGGKTSVLRAIQTALIANDVSPDAIRLGEEEAEIVVNFDDVSVRRKITQKGQSLVVVNDAGDVKAKPQTWLNEVLGTTAIDPIDFFEKKPPERRELLLKALPIVVTPEQVEKWVGTERAKEIVAEGLLAGHGLDVCTKLHKIAYDRRTKANAEYKVAKEALERVERDPVYPPDIPISEETAKAAKDSADRAKVDLDARAERALKADERTRTTRETIATHRGVAKQLREQYPEPDFEEVERIGGEVQALSDAVRAAEEALAVARNKLAMREEDYQGASAVAHDRREKRAQADSRERQAAELEATLQATTEPPVTEEDRRNVENALLDAETLVKEADLTKRAEEYEKKVKEAMEAAAAKKKVAVELDLQVDAWANRAPKELLTEQKGIPGLSLQGDRILMDGVAIDSLSGREQLLFAVEVARRANAKTKILIVDGLERVDPDQLPDFVRRATADGFQLIATKVDRGEVQMEAIEVES